MCFFYKNKQLRKTIISVHLSKIQTKIVFLIIYKQNNLCFCLFLCLWLSTVNSRIISGLRYICSIEVFENVYFCYKCTTNARLTNNGEHNQHFKEVWKSVSTNIYIYFNLYNRKTHMTFFFVANKNKF